jgi:carboxymethylenebutenolidase
MARRFPIAALLLVGACTIQRTPGPAALAKTPTAARLSGAMGGMDDHSAHMRAEDLAAPSTTGSVSVQDLALPPSNSAAPDRLKNSRRHGEWVKIAYEPGSADSLMAWVVYPFAKDSREKAPVVVVVHEIFGLSTWVRGVADQVAADGFIAIAPDFLSKVRGGPSSEELRSDSASRIIRSLTAADKNRTIIAAANYAMMLPSAQQKYSVIGYCWGGTAVWNHAVNGGVKGYSGGVAFYGAPYTKGGSPATPTTAAVPAQVDTDSLARITKPVMLLNGTKDARIGALMPEIDAFMKSAKKEYTGVNYDGAVHGFLRAQSDPKPTRDEAEEAANVAATKDGWPRTVAFLKRVMR